MNAQTAFLRIAECEFEDNGVVKSWDAPKPIKNFTAAWNIGELTFNRHSVLFAYRKNFPLPLAGSGQGVRTIILKHQLIWKARRITFRLF